MGTSLVTNLASLATVHTLNRTSSALETSQRRLSTGLRISRASDDAAGLGISEGLRSQIGGMTQAIRNTQDGIGVVQLADGALGQMSSILMRMRDLSVEAGNSGALNADALAAIQKELTQLGGEVDHIAGTTSFNGIPLLDGTYDRAFQVGANAGETIRVAIGGPGFAINRAGLGLTGIDITGPAFSLPSSVIPAVSADQGAPANGHVILSGDWTTPGVAEANFRALRGTISYNGKTFDLGSVDYTGCVTPSDYFTKLDSAAMAAMGTSGHPLGANSTQLEFSGDTPGPGSTAADAAALTPQYAGVSGASAAMTALGKAIDIIASTRADLGAIQNRFEQTVKRLSGALADTSASESRIRDTDMASEASAMSRAQVLVQAGSAVLAQANQSPQTLLKLLAA